MTHKDKEIGKGKNRVCLGTLNENITVAIKRIRCTNNKAYLKIMNESTALAFV